MDKKTPENTAKDEDRKRILVEKEESKINMD